MATLTSTKAAKNGNGLGPKTIIATITGSTPVTQAELDGALQSIQAGVTVSNVFYPGGTIAGVVGFGGNTVYVAVQGASSLEGTTGTYHAGVDVTTIATFG